MHLRVRCTVRLRPSDLCMALGYQIGFREGEQIEQEKHTEDDGPIEMEHRHGE